MNHAIIGKPRNGKGRYSAHLIHQELEFSKRRFITNFAVEKYPWVTADHKPRRGLLDFLVEKHGDTFNARERIFRLTDEAISCYFLYRGLSKKEIENLGEKHLQGYRKVTREDGVLVESEWQHHNDIELYVADHVSHEDKRGKKVVDEYDTRLASASGGHVNMIDEAWKFWPARGWSNTSEALNFHFAQVGKFTDENWLITHRINDVDSILVDRCQDFHVCTNHGKLNFSWFRQPSVFSVAVYSTKPTPSAEPTGGTKIFKQDKFGIMETFDTSAGVGVSGRAMADIGQRAKGVPMWLIPVIGVSVIVAILVGGKYALAYIRNKITGKPAVVKVADSRLAMGQGAVNQPASAMPAQASVESARRPGSNPVPAVQNVTGGVYGDSNAVYCVGYTVIAGQATVYLSDGSVAYGDNLEVDLIAKHHVICFGKMFRIKTPNLPYVPRNENWVVATSANPHGVGQAPVNQAEILPSVSGVSPEAPVSLNGFASMNSRIQSLRSAGF